MFLKTTLRLYFILYAKSEIAKIRACVIFYLGNCLCTINLVGILRTSITKYPPKYRYDFLATDRQTSQANFENVFYEALGCMATLESIRPGD